MKVFVAGATGRVGQAVVKLLLAQGDQVLAGGRNLAQLPAEVTPVALDLHASVAELQAKLADSQAVIFTGGSRGQDLLQTDLNGAVKLMMAAQAVGIKRFIHLSSACALDQTMWAKVPALAQLMDYNIAKFFSDRWLMDETTLAYTIIQAGILTPTPATGKVSLNPATSGENSIEDVAAVLVASLAEPKTIRQVIMMKAGTTPIAEALAQL